MLRTLFAHGPYQSLTLNSTIKTILQTGLLIRNGSNGIRSTVYTSCSLSGHFGDPKKYNFAKCASHHKCSKFLHTNVVQNVAAVSAGNIGGAYDIKKAMQEFYKINMRDLKEAPLAAFWVGFAGLTPFMFPPISSLIIGYSPFLANFQLAYGIAILGCVGGVKWGFLVSSPKEENTWENYMLSAVPVLIATVAVAAPVLLSYLLVIAGLLAAFIADLTTSRYPRWFIALRGVLTNISVFFLFISFLQKLIH